jgi:hypothetical protein
MLANNSVYAADDACTDALDKAIDRWDRSIHTYNLKPIKKTFSDMSKEWKTQRKGTREIRAIKDCKILTNNIQLLRLLTPIESSCLFEDAPEEWGKQQVTVQQGPIDS